MVNFNNTASETMAEIDREKGVTHWRRYASLEIAGTVTAFLAGALALMFNLPTAVAAYVATFAENLGFYGTAFLLERKKEKSFHKAVLSLVVEFGPAEVLDTLFVRPACMFAGIALLGTFGILIGKLAADLVFYTIASILRRYATPSVRN